MKKFTFLFMLILICLISVGTLVSCSEEADDAQKGTCNHTFGDWVVSKEATCTEEGYKERFCYFCDSVIGITVDPINHDWVEATCMAPKTCSICFATEGDRGVHHTDIIPSVQQTCISSGWSQGVKCVVCEEILVAPEEIPPHFRREIPMVPSTCTIPGKTAGERCYVCQKILIPQQPISCHEPVPFPGLDATCVSTGLKKGTTCSICNERVSGQDVIEFIDHTFDENGYCTQCKNKKPSEGLVYSAAEGGAYYGVSGIGTCTDTDIVISPTYNGKLVMYITTGAFKGNANIKSVTIPNTVVTINPNAFANCESLETVVMADSVINIKSGAFANNPSLKTLNISASVKVLDPQIFFGCDSLVVEENGVYYIDNWAIGSTYNATLFAEGDEEEEEIAPIVISLRAGTVGIATEAFKGCVASEIIIPNSVLYINDYAFAGCLELEKITLSNELTALSNGMFKDCISLKDIAIPAKVASVGNEAFNGCAALESIVIPENVATIGTGAFSGCDALTSIIFENTAGWYAKLPDGDVPMWVNIVEDLTVKLTLDYSSYVWIRK